MDHLSVLREFAEAKRIPIIRSDSEKVLRALVVVARPKRILEIGTSIGYSGAAMLLSAGPEARLLTADRNENALKSAQRTFDEFGLGKRVTLLFGDEGESLRNLTESCDFIFLDGPKRQYIAYYPYLMGLLAPGGILFCDNIYSHADAKDEPGNKSRAVHSNLREFLRELKANQDLHTEFLDCGDGIALSVKNL